MLREHAAHDIFVDVEAEGVGDLLGDVHTAELGVAPFYFNNGNSADATRTEDLRKRDEQVHRQKDQVAHEWKVITFVTLRKTARRGLVGLGLRN